MRTYDNGCFFSVACTESDVASFAYRWPCFGKREAMWFQFDKRNGDLVDIQGGEDSDERGVLALSHDAQFHGAKRLKLDMDTHDKRHLRF